MTFQRAALFAAIGVLLRGLHYLVANLIPGWNSSGVTEQIGLLIVTFVDPLIWTYYFVTLWRGLPNRIAAYLAALLGLAEIGFAAYSQWQTLSPTSLDSLAFFFGAVLPVFFWTLYLLGRRFGLWYLLLFNLAQTALSVYQVVTSWPAVQEYWRDEPWQLLVAPAIWTLYWATQALFIRAAQRRTNAVPA